MQLLRTLGRFAGRAIVLGFMVYLLVFVAFAVLPLDPARSLLGPMASSEAVSELNAHYGLDLPLPAKLAKVTLRAVQGDFGVSLIHGVPVVPLVASALGTTLVRLLLALTIGFMMARKLVPVLVSTGFQGTSTLLAGIAGVPSFVLLALLLMVFASGFGLSPFQHPLAYNVLAVLVAALVVFVTVALTIFERINYQHHPSRPAQFLLMLHAPVDRLVHILMRSAMPAAFAALANSVAPALTALTFAEYVFGLDGFGVMFLRACSYGDMAVVAFGSLIVAFLFALVQSGMATSSRMADRRMV